MERLWIHFIPRAILFSGMTQTQKTLFHISQMYSTKYMSLWLSNIWGSVWTLKCNTWWQKILSIYCVVGLLWVLCIVIYRFSQQQFYAGLSSLRTLFIVSGYTIYIVLERRILPWFFFGLAIILSCVFIKFSLQPLFKSIIFSLIYLFIFLRYK